MDTPRNTIELVKALKAEKVPEKDYPLYFNRFLESKARKLGIPLTGNFELTPLCNLSCRMCYVHLSKGQFRSKDLLRFDVWKDLIDQAHAAGMMNASLTGGECLTHPDFGRIYLYLRSKGVVPGILTNGILMDNRRIEFFKENPPRMIQVSLYGSSEQAYEAVTGERVFGLVYQNILNIHHAGLPVKITITPNAFMENDIYSLIDTAQNLNIPYNINANLIPPRKNTGRKTYDLPVDKYVEMFKYRSVLNADKLLPVDPEELPDESRDGRTQYGLECGAGRSSFAIRYDGCMLPCLSLDEIAVNPLKDGFQAAWQELFSLANQYPRPMECGACVYHDYCLRCAAMHMNAPLKGHCDKRICERTKKLIAAGYIPVPSKT